MKRHVRLLYLFFLFFFLLFGCIGCGPPKHARCVEWDSGICIAWLCDIGYSMTNDGKCVSQEEIASAERARDRSYALNDLVTGDAHLEKGEYDDAIDDYDLAEEQKIHLDGSEKALLYMHRGIAYYSKGDYDWAIEDYSKGIDYAESVLLHPGEDLKVAEFENMLGRAYNNRAAAYYFEKDYDKSWEDVHKAETLGVEAKPEFLKALREASGTAVTEAHLTQHQLRLVTYQRKRPLIWVTVLRWNLS
jgi:tetratricopeptide (TPR) repeat protein